MRDGISGDKGLLDRWPKGGPQLKWKATGLGVGFSSISIADGKIFTIGDHDGDQWLIALDLAHGKKVWETKIGKAWVNNYSGSRSTPTVDGDRLYVLGTHGDLVCATIKNGTVVWRRSLPADFQGHMHSIWGYAESPLVDGQKVVCTPGGPEAGIVALNKKSGREIWRCTIPELGPNGSDGAGYSSIVVSTAAGVRQYVQLMGRGVVGVAASNGKFLWGYNRIANGTANIPTPLVSKEFVFCSTGYRTGAALLKLRSDGEGVAADEVYFLDGKKLQNHHGGMVMIGDYIYCGHGHKAGAPTCLEWRTGEIKWRRDRGPGSGSAAVVYADGHVYFRYENGLMALLTATPKEYEERGTFEIPECEEPSWSVPVVAGGRLYLREQDNLFVYDVHKPS